MNKEINPIFASFLVMVTLAVMLGVSKFIGTMNPSWWVVTAPVWIWSIIFIGTGVISFIVFMWKRPEE